MKLTKTILHITLLVIIFILSTAITLACTDSDGDGFNASENGCCNASLNCDCDDSSANIRPPQLSFTFTSAGNYQLCNGTYSIPTGGTLMATTHNNNITCRGTTLQGNASGFGFYIAQGTNITIRNCTFRDYENGILVNNISNGTIHNNSFYNNLASDETFVELALDNAKDTNITSNFFKSINGGNGISFCNN